MKYFLCGLRGPKTFFGRVSDRFIWSFFSRFFKPLFRIDLKVFSGAIFVLQTCRPKKLGAARQLQPQNRRSAGHKGPLRVVMRKKDRGAGIPRSNRSKQNNNGQQTSLKIQSQLNNVQTRCIAKGRGSEKSTFLAIFLGGFWFFSGAPVPLGIPLEKPFKSKKKKTPIFYKTRLANRLFFAMRLVLHTIEQRPSYP